VGKIHQAIRIMLGMRIGMISSLSLFAENVMVLIITLAINLLKVSIPLILIGLLFCHLLGIYRG